MGISLKTTGSVGGTWIDLGLSATDVVYIFANEQAYGIAHNSASRDAPRALQAGTPTQSGGGVQFTGLTNFLSTPVNEPTEGTYFLVATTAATGLDNANRAYFLGTYGANSKLGAGIYQSTATQASLAAQHSGSAVVAAITHDWTVPSILCGRFDQTRSAIKNHTSGASAVATTAVARNLNAARVRLGSVYTDFGGTNIIYFAVVINRYLSDAEADATASLIRRALTDVVSV